MDIKERINVTRPTRIYCDRDALLHNLNIIKQCAPNQQIMAMVKANAYGCGVEVVVPILDKKVTSFGVASLEEALAIRHLDVNSPCVLLQGVFSPEEYVVAAKANFQCVIHHPLQLSWLVNNRLAEPLRIWVKVDTGMHRLGFLESEIASVLAALRDCPWVSSDIGLMTHFACADEVNNLTNKAQLHSFNRLTFTDLKLTRSLANSAAILSMPDSHADMVRPGIMLYGVSPFPNQTGKALGLRPVMHFLSEITAIHHYPADFPIGYGATWSSKKPSIIGVVPVGYADGYPRHIRPHTPIWVNGVQTEIVGRISMDMLSVDLTNHPDAKIGSPIELWGDNIPVEVIAESAGTIGYELLTKITKRGRNTTLMDEMNS